MRWRRSPPGGAGECSWLPPSVREGTPAFSESVGRKLGFQRFSLWEAERGSNWTLVLYADSVDQRLPRAVPGPDSSPMGIGPTSYSKSRWRLA